MSGPTWAPEGIHLQTDSNSLQLTLENVTARTARSQDADFAAETANLTRAQVLVSARHSVLATANNTPEQCESEHES